MKASGVAETEGGGSFRVFSSWLGPSIMLLSILLVYPFAFTFSVSDRLKLFSPASISLLALALLFLSFKKFSPALAGMKLAMLIPVSALSALACAHFIADGAYKLEDLGFSLIWVSLPLYSWLNWQAFEWLLPRFLAFLWVFDICITGRQLLSGSELSGLPGNRNWHAALLLICTPFLLKYLYKTMRRRFSRLPAPASLAILLAPLAASLLAFQRCHSRGAWLALAAALSAGAFLAAGAKLRRAMVWTGICAAAVLSLSFVLLGVDHAAKIISEDERLILWDGTLKLIGEHPAWGVGGASFESEFAPLRPIEYFFNMHSAVRSNHPHNHLLFIASCFGLAGLLAWLPLLFWPLLAFASKFKEEANPDMKMLFLATLALVVHSMFDLVLFEWPTSVLTLLSLGLLWARAWPPVESCPAYAREGVRRCAAPLAACASACLLLLTLASICRTASGSWFAWKAAILSRAGRAEAAAYFNRRAAEICKSEPILIYRGMTQACIDVRDFALSLDFLERLDETPGSNFAHSNGFRGKCLASLGRTREAIPYLVRETRNYPLQVIPLYNLAAAYLKLGRLEQAAAAEASIAKVMESRGLDARLLPLILKKPDYDLRPWEIIPEDARTAPDSEASH